MKNYQENAKTHKFSLYDSYFMSGDSQVLQILSYSIRYEKTLYFSMPKEIHKYIYIGIFQFRISNIYITNKNNDIKLSVFH